MLERHRALIGEFLRANALPPGWLSGKLVAYHMGWADSAGRPQSHRSGKLLRPTLCLWACGACGERVQAALPAAAAIEWFHNFTLVHDDIADGDRTRRGRETVWSLWGIPQAVNAGDAMQTIAFFTLCAQSDRPDRAACAAAELARAGLRVVEGQCLDLELERQTEAELRAYLRMAGAKTGSLLGATLAIGAIMAGADPNRIAHFRRAGQLLGTAFQIRDDWLGMFGDPVLTGKSSTNDAARFKMSFPIVASLRTMSTLQRRRLREIFRSEHENPHAKLRALVGDVGGEAATRAAAVRYARKSASSIARAGIARAAVEEFEEVAYYVATRSR